MRTAAAEGLQVLKAAAAGAGERMPLAFSCSSATCWAELLHVQARLTHRIHSLTCSSAAPSRPSHLVNASRSCSQRSVASETCARSSEQKRQRASLRARVVVERHLIERVGQLRRRRHLCLKLGLHARTSVTLQHCACTPSHALTCSSCTLLRSASATLSQSIMRREAEVSLDSTSFSSSCTGVSHVSQTRTPQPAVSSTAAYPLPAGAGRARRSASCRCGGGAPAEQLPATGPARRLALCLATASGV